MRLYNLLNSYQFPPRTNRRFGYFVGWPLPENNHVTDLVAAPPVKHFALFLLKERTLADIFSYTYSALTPTTP